MLKHFSKTSLVIVLISVVAACAAILYIHKRWPTITIVPLQSNSTQGNSTQNTSASNTASANKNTGTPSSSAQSGTSSSLPTTFTLPIPFTPQAPTGNWDTLHNEACEEAAAIMANAYLTGDKDVVMPPASVETQITTLTNWEQQNFGYYLDTTAAETAKMIEGVYGLKTQIINNYSEEQVKQALNNHEVVIIPEDGQLLGNPNYKTPGPIYHMLVIRGYTPDAIITNDSGTKNGRNYSYSFATIYDSGANWDHSTNTIDKNVHIAIIVSK
jgi:hypothetical protein